MNIGVIGLGYVGLTFSVVAAMNGHNVFGIDSNPVVKKALSKKKAHFYEPGLNDLLALIMDKSLHVVDGFTQDMQLDTFLVSVGTPLNTRDKAPDLEHLKNAVLLILDTYDGSQLIVLRSTVSVGTTRSVVLPMLQEQLIHAATDNKEPFLAFCPERTVEGSAVKELQELPQIIGGLNEQSVEIAEKLFRALTPTIVQVESLEAAELIKLFNNTYRDVHFSIGNLFNEIAQSFNLNGLDIVRAANLGYERSNIPKPGFVGGPCLEKDTYILTHNLRSKPGKEFVLGARRYNEELHTATAQWIMSKAPPKGSVLLTGMAFKGHPATGDLRGSSSVAVAQQIQGLRVFVHDFFADVDELKALNCGSVLETLEHGSIFFDVIAILTNSKKYQDVGLSFFQKMLRNDGVILDVWHVFEYQMKIYEQHPSYYHLGNWNAGNAAKNNNG